MSTVVLVRLERPVAAEEAVGVRFRFAAAAIFVSLNVH